METREAIFGRRSVRKYIDKPINDEILKILIEGASMAPSADNLQPWYFVAVRSEENINKLRNIFKEISKKGKPQLENRFPNHPEVVGETLGFIKSLGNASTCILAFLLKPNYNESVSAWQSVSAAIENICLLAHDEGIGSCWLTAPLETGYSEVIESEFAPEAGSLVAAITLGYPAFEPKAPKRKQGRYKII